MKIKFKPRSHTNINDCWCDAIALATGQTYEHIEEIFKPMINPDGSLTGSFIHGYMRKSGFKNIDTNQDSNETIGRAAALYNSRDHHILLMTEDHAVYLSNHTIYDNIDVEARSEYLKQHVMDIWFKAKE